MKLFLIDALAPFIDEQNPPLNWSRAPLYDFEDLRQHSPRIIERFEVFVKRVHQEGFNAISIDDLAHLVTLDIYSPSLRKKLEQYKALYIALFGIAKKYDVRVFVNFDIMYFNQEIERYTRGKDEKILELLQTSLEQLFDTYEVAGVITRIGECDGVDVKSLFTSRLTLKTPAQAKRYLIQLLPLFEARKKLWIFRTWSLGAYQIGDLMWNKKTFLRVFGTIRSDNLIISMKYGDADFFRNLELNPLFRLHRWNLLIEFQARREYDGFGELPFYTGWDYERYYEQLKDHKRLQGFSLWCMTGGWKKSDQIIFSEHSSPWVELNTLSTVKIFQGARAEQCVTDFFHDGRMVEFLREYNALSQQIMYPNVERKKYFKKVRIPPLAWIFWGNVTVNSLVVSYFKYALKDEYRVTAADIERVYVLGRECRVPNLEFIHATLGILHECRQCLDGNFDLDRLHEHVQLYTQQYPDFLNFSLPKKLQPSRFLRVLLYLFVRNTNRYRLLDFLIFNRLFPMPLIRLYLFLKRKSFPAFVNSQAMPIETFLK